jgi:hypothetical protein
LELRSSRYEAKGARALSGPIPDALKPFQDALAELLADAVLREYVAEAVARPLSARQTDAEAEASADATAVTTTSSITALSAMGSVRDPNANNLGVIQIRTMLKAAIYARKSTDDSNRNPENKSVARQVDNANAYAQTKGWTVDERHIYERLNAELAECGDRLDIDIDDRQLKQMLSTQMGRFNELMTGDVPRARQETIDGKGTLLFRGETNLGTLLQPTFITLASPRGRHPE